MDEVEREILAEARRAIEVQVAALDELRSRTGLLLAALALSGSLLGSATANNDILLSAWGVAAIVFFSFGVVACIVILWPPKDDAWTFVNGPKQLIADWVKISRPDESMNLFLAECLEDHYDANQERLLNLYRWFQRASISVGAAVILGVAQLALGH